MTVTHLKSFLEPQSPEKMQIKITPTRKKSLYRILYSFVPNSQKLGMSFLGRG